MVYQNTYQYKSRYGEERVVIELLKYADNTTRVQLRSADDYSPYATLSTNLGAELEEDEFFLDVNNNPEAEDWLHQLHLAEPTGEQEKSGFCTYPKYRLNMAQITKPYEP